MIIILLSLFLFQKVHNTQKSKMRPKTGFVQMGHIRLTCSLFVTWWTDASAENGIRYLGHIMPKPNMLTPHPKHTEETQAPKNSQTVQPLQNDLAPNSTAAERERASVDQDVSLW